MIRFYVSKVPSKDGLHEIHVQGCEWMPVEGGRLFLGMCSTSNQAAAIAQNLFRKVCPCSCCLDSAVIQTASADESGLTYLKYTVN